MFTAPYTIITHTAHGIKKEVVNYITAAVNHYMNNNDPVEVYDANGVEIPSDILESL